VRDGIGLLEINGLSPALVALDALEKAAAVRLFQLELNDFYGVVLKFTGDSASLRAAIDVARQTVEQMKGQCTSAILDAPDERARRAIESKQEFSPLLEAPVVFFPNYEPAGKEIDVTEARYNAIGLIETQGFTAVLQAIDSACKAANVEVLGKEKLGGGYITVLIAGDVAAVQAAVDAGKARVEGLGKLIAAHVISRPSDGVLSLLPRG
jgi:microcompartment protein CcmL/EutN